MGAHRLAVFLAALWWGGISALSFVAVPTLFSQLGAPVAGPVAARLFSLQCWAGLGIGLTLLLLMRRERAAMITGIHSQSTESVQVAAMQHLLASMGFVLAAMLLAMLQEFGVAHRIVSARATGGDLRFWHSLGSVMVLGQWICAGTLLWRLVSWRHLRAA